MKKTLQRLCSALLVVCMLTTAAPAAMAASDIEGHWAQTALENFIHNGWLEGYGNGRYGPDDSMTRAQYAALINRVTGLTEESGKLAGYTDVSSGAWYYADLAKALAAGYMSGTTATTMAPNATITRQQAITMVARLLGLTAAEEDLAGLERFQDLDQVNDYAKNSMAAMVAAGYVNGTADSRLMPQQLLTRAQGITILYNAREALQALRSAAGDLKDGVYTGTGAGYGGTMTVKMTVSGGRITAVEVVSHSETNAYFNRAKKLIDTVLERQDTQGVDTVSGATKSSNGLLTAIGACISQARGGADTSKTGTTGGGGGAGNSTRPEDKDFLGALTDGTYTGSARGYSGTTQVTVTVSGGRITAVTVDSHGDTTSYFNRALAVIDRLIAAQSTSVDAVSGATYSSYGIINAVADALKDAAPTTAKTYSVSSWSEFLSALAKAVDGDTVKLAGDITDAGEEYDAAAHASLVDAVSSATLGMATVNKAITIDGGGNTISAGADKAYCFNISGSGVVIKDVTIDGASYGARMGGGLYLAGGHGSTGAAPSLELKNVTVKNCASYKTGMPGNGGGAIYAKGAVTLTATDCTFAGNDVVNAGFGGAVYAQNANVTLTGCTFTDNHACQGGAVAAAGSANLVVENCTFRGNDADYGGNDVYIFDGMTPGKANAYSNSAVSFALSGNTFSNDGDSWQDYAVVLGRYYDADGKYAGNGADVVFPAGHDLTFADVGRTELAAENDSEYVSLWMNIPYADFYAAELKNSVPVDAVSSATLNKTRSGGMMSGGSYHVNADGSDITGVIFPVLMPRDADLGGYTQVTEDSSVTITVTNRGQTSETTYTGRDALFEAPSYSYYVADSIPAFYKVASIAEDGELTFGKAQGVTTALSGVSASLLTDTAYGDYQLNLMDSGLDDLAPTVYGVILSTREGDSYGLRHLENVWRYTQLAWCTGFTAAVHGCPTDSDHYASIMGKTITGVTYLTDQGKFSVSLGDGVYVPVKFEHALAAADATVDNGNCSTAVAMTGFPGEYAPVYTVTNAAGEAQANFTCDGAALTWTGAPAIGAYTLTVSDAKGVYAPCSAGFVLSTGAVPARFDPDSLALTAADGFDADALAGYLAGISTVTVNGRAYAASGRGSVSIIRADGSLDLEARSGASRIFEPGKTCSVAVASTGYSNALTFTVTAPASALADGVWYGTATEGKNFEMYGPSVVRVTVQNGVIEDASSVKYTDDDSMYEQSMYRLLAAVRGLSSLTAVDEQISGRSGAYYDAVSGATITAKGHLTALNNALARSAQYQEDGVNQVINWMDFDTRPSPAYYGEALDLSGVRLTLHLMSGEDKVVPFSELADYGIACNWENGTVINPDTPGVDGSSITVMFTHALSRSLVNARAALSVRTEPRDATHILVTYADGATDTIALSADAFRYDFKPAATIESMVLYDGEERLADGSYYAAGNSYSFDLKDVPAGEGKSWRWTTYRVDCQRLVDPSAIVSFTVENNGVRQYKVGEAFSMAGVDVTVKTASGNTLQLSGWDECVNRGFTVSPAVGYVFTSDDAGQQTITLSVGDVSGTFQVTVEEEDLSASQVPDLVKLMDGDTVVYTFSGLSAEWTETDGHVTRYDVQLPAQYRDWTAETFQASAVNSAGTPLNVSIQKVRSTMRIMFPDYGEAGGYIMFIPSFAEGE